MAIKRYTSAPVLGAGKYTGTTNAMSKIRRAVERGSLACTPHILKEAERLDIIAGKVYGNSKLWWVIAAASGIGWALQVPPGTVLYIPKNLDEITTMV